MKIPTARETENQFVASGSSIGCPTYPHPHRHQGERARDCGPRDQSRECPGHYSYSRPPASPQSSGGASGLSPRQQRAPTAQSPGSAQAVDCDRAGTAARRALLPLRPPTARRRSHHHYPLQAPTRRLQIPQGHRTWEQLGPPVWLKVDTNRYEEASGGFLSAPAFHISYGSSTAVSIRSPSLLVLTF